jgi:hypothetical protein
MRKNVTLLFLCLFSMVYAQSDYIPLVEEGKRWNYGDYVGPSWPSVYSYLIVGDTIIGYQDYKKVLKLTHNDSVKTYYAAIREQEKRVYTILADATEEALLYDFGMSVGSIVIINGIGLQYSPLYSVKGSDGLIYQLINMKFNWDHTDYTGPIAPAISIWAEGVGCVVSDLFDPTESHCLYSFQSCYRGDVCSFVSEDVFNIVLPEGVNDLRKDEGRHSSTFHNLYDLQGRRLTTQPRRGIYVKDGKIICTGN